MVEQIAEYQETIFCRACRMFRRSEVDTANSGGREALRCAHCHAFARWRREEEGTVDSVIGYDAWKTTEPTTPEDDRGVLHERELLRCQAWQDLEYLASESAERYGWDAVVLAIGVAMMRAGLGPSAASARDAVQGVEEFFAVFAKSAKEFAAIEPDGWSAVLRAVGHAMKGKG